MDDIEELEEESQYSFPSISTIHNYTVGELKDDLEKYYLNDKKQPGKGSLLYHAILLTTYKYIKNKTFGGEQAFAEYLDTEPSGLFFETTPIPLGCLAAVNVACTRRLFKKEENNTTSFGLAKILDRYDDDNMTLEDQGGIGGALMNEVRYAMLDELRMIKSADITFALKTRFKKILNTNAMFNFDGETISLNDPKLCELEDKYGSLKEAVYSVSPWYGQQSVYSTTAIEKIFVLSYCVEAVAVYFDEIFEIVKHKVANFLHNTPLNLDGYFISDDEDDDDKKPLEADYDELQVPSITIQENAMYYENLANDFLESLDSDDIKIFYGSINGKTLLQIEETVDLKKSTIDDRKKKIMKNLQDYFNNNKVEDTDIDGFYSALKSFEKAKIL